MKDLCRAIQMTLYRSKTLPQMRMAFAPLLWMAFTCPGGLRSPGLKSEKLDNKHGRINASPRLHRTKLLRISPLAPGLIRKYIVTHRLASFVSHRRTPNHTSPSKIAQTKMSASPPLDIPVSARPAQAVYNTPVLSQTMNSLQEFPFGRQLDKANVSLDFNQLQQHLHNVEMSRLSDDLSYALEAC